MKILKKFSKYQNGGETTPSSQSQFSDETKAALLEAAKLNYSQGGGKELFRSIMESLGHKFDDAELKRQYTGLVRSAKKKREGTLFEGLGSTEDWKYDLGLKTPAPNQSQRITQFTEENPGIFGTTIDMDPKTNTYFNTAQDIHNRNKKPGKTFVVDDKFDNTLEGFLHDKSGLRQSERDAIKWILKNKKPGQVMHVNITDDGYVNLHSQNGTLIQSGYKLGDSSVMNSPEAKEHNLQEAFMKVHKVNNMPDNRHLEEPDFGPAFTQEDWIRMKELGEEELEPESKYLNRIPEEVEEEEDIEILDTSKMKERDEAKDPNAMQIQDDFIYDDDIDVEGVQEEGEHIPEGKVDVDWDEMQELNDPEGKVDVDWDEMQRLNKITPSSQQDSKRSGMRTDVSYDEAWNRMSDEDRARFDNNQENFVTEAENWWEEQDAKEKLASNQNQGMQFKKKNQDNKMTDSQQINVGENEGLGLKEKLEEKEGLGLKEKLEEKIEDLDEDVASAKKGMYIKYNTGGAVADKAEEAKDKLKDAFSGGGGAAGSAKDKLKDALGSRKGAAGSAKGKLKEAFGKNKGGSTGISAKGKLSKDEPGSKMKRDSSRMEKRDKFSLTGKGGEEDQDFVGPMLPVDPNAEKAGVKNVNDNFNNNMSVDSKFASVDMDPDKDGLPIGVDASPFGDDEAPDTRLDVPSETPEEEGYIPQTQREDEEYVPQTVRDKEREEEEKTVVGKGAEKGKEEEEEEGVKKKKKRAARGPVGGGSSRKGGGGQWDSRGTIAGGSVIHAPSRRGKRGMYLKKMGRSGAKNRMFLKKKA